MARLYRRVKLMEGQEVQFVGVYVLRWGKETEPTVGFVEATDEEMRDAAKEHPVENVDG